MEVLYIVLSFFIERFHGSQALIVEISILWRSRLDSSFATGRDQDEFDLTCHHLVVEHRESGMIVGTYRLQTPQMACGPEGLYTATEYDLAMMPDEILRHSVEVGRACVAREHRERQVLYLLWRGLALYMAHNRLRYFFG